jgi:protein-S-isoprenylcysteine O-methyltransferase Ste14
MDNVAKGRLLVTIQFILLAGIAFTTSDDLFPNISFIKYVGWTLELVGFVIVILGFRGLGPSLTANPVPLKTGKLVTKGIYHRVRHPIYLGLILATLGIVLVNGSLTQFVFWLPLVILLVLKIRFEEALLANKYPDYKKYKEQVPAFIPKMKR